MNQPLPLTPLPSVRTDEENASLLMEREGFVDESVVRALMTGPVSRGIPSHEDLALAADDLDFAGWRLAPAAPVRRQEIPPQVIEAIVRRAMPPSEPGLGAPHQGSHRWWLAGLAGALSTLLFSVLLLSLSHRPGQRFENIVWPPAVLRTAPAPVAQPAQEASAELTDLSVRR